MKKIVIVLIGLISCVHGREAVKVITMFSGASIAELLGQNLNNCAVGIYDVIEDSISVKDNCTECKGTFCYNDGTLDILHIACRSCKRTYSTVSDKADTKTILGNIKSDNVKRDRLCTKNVQDIIVHDIITHDRRFPTRGIILSINKCIIRTCGLHDPDDDEDSVVPPSVIDIACAPVS